MSRINNNGINNNFNKIYFEEESDCNTFELDDDCGGGIRKNLD